MLVTPGPNRKGRAAGEEECCDIRNTLEMGTDFHQTKVQFLELKVSK